MNGRFRVAIYFLGLATFVTYLSAQLITPIVPALAKRLGAEDLSIASVSGSYIVFLALFQIFTGAFADRFGKRRTISLGAFLAALSSLLIVLASSWEQLLILRVCGGVADAIAGPALLALVAEIGVEEKGKAMGIFRSSQGLAFIIGPTAGGALAYLFSIYAPFYVDFSLTILGILLFLLLIRERRREREAVPFSAHRALGSLWKNLPLMKIAYLGFSETFGFAALCSFLPVMALGQGMSEVEIALFFSAEAIAFTATNLVVGMLSDRIGRRPIMIVGLVVSSLNFLAFFYARDFWPILALMALYGFASSSVYVTSSTMAADVLPEEGRAMLFGAFDALMDLGLVAGPTICFVLISIFRWSTHASFLLMAIPTMAALTLIPHLKETMT